MIKQKKIREADHHKRDDDSSVDNNNNNNNNNNDNNDNADWEEEKVLTTSDVTSQDVKNLHNPSVCDVKPMTSSKRTQCLRNRSMLHQYFFYNALLCCIHPFCQLPAFFEVLLQPDDSFFGWLLLRDELLALGEGMAFHMARINQCALPLIISFYAWRLLIGAGGLCRSQFDSFDIDLRTVFYRTKNRTTQPGQPFCILTPLFSRIITLLTNSRRLPLLRPQTPPSVIGRGGILYSSFNAGHKLLSIFGIFKFFRLIALPALVPGNNVGCESTFGTGTVVSKDLISSTAKLNRFLLKGSIKNAKQIISQRYGNTIIISHITLKEPFRLSQRDLKFFEKIKSSVIINMGSHLKSQLKSIPNILGL